MNKEQAAEFLGVSIRTLERLVASGRLKAGRALKKTRPVVVFEKADVEALKTELDDVRPAEVFRRLNTEKKKAAIGFRLDPFYIKKLEEEGAKSGLSSGEYARRLVIRGLDTTNEIQALKGSLAHMFFLILVTKMGATEEEADEIVKSLG